MRVKKITKSHKRRDLSFCLGQSDSSGWGIEWDKSWWNRVLLPHRWSIVCQHQSAWNGRTVHSSAHGLLKRVGCFWMPQAHSSLQKYYWIEPIYLPLYQLRMHFLIYTSIWLFSLWRIPLHAALGLVLLCMKNGCNEYTSLTLSEYQQKISAKQMYKWHHLSSSSKPWYRWLRYAWFYAEKNHDVFDGLK